MEEFSVSGNVINTGERKIIKGTVFVKNGIIEKIVKNKNVKSNVYILPGFVDAHIHIESSMLVPSEFASIAVKHGTVATVSDPHEIANVLGVDGVNFMIENGKKTPLKFYFGAPSCVPATSFETSGAKLNAKEIDSLLKRDDIFYLSEMMNFPGVIQEDNEVIKKIKSSIRYKKKIDGHAPGLSKAELNKYINQKIETDHECTTIEEAREKIRKGMKIQIREGSAAKNFNELCSLIDESPERVMLCSDDLHPDDLIDAHINKLVKKALKKKINLFNVLNAATTNPVKHYNMNVGLLREGDPADFIIIDNLEELNVLATYIDGEKVFNGKESCFNVSEPEIINNFKIKEISHKNFLKVEVAEKRKIRVIEAFDKSLFTDEIHINPKIENNCIIPDLENDILKIAVINRYKKSNPIVGFIKNVGLKRGAMASSVAHDSHNIIAIGTNDEDILFAINLIIKNKGGLSISDKHIHEVLPLPIAGIMSNLNAYDVAAGYKRMNKLAKSLGCKLNAPFMTMSFMALLVIPKLKIGDMGLFDVNKFNLTTLTV